MLLMMESIRRHQRSSEVINSKGTCYMYCKDSIINFTYPARHEESRVVPQVSLYTTGEPQGVPDAGRGCCAGGLS